MALVKLAVSIEAEGYGSGDKRNLQVRSLISEAQGLLEANADFRASGLKVETKPQRWQGWDTTTLRLKLEKGSR